MNPFNRYSRGWLLNTPPVGPDGTPQGGGGGTPPLIKPPAAAAPDPERQRMEQELQRTRTQVEQLQRMVMAQPQPQQGNQGPDKKELEKEFIKNPLDMSTAIADRVVQQRMAAMNGPGSPSFDTNVQMAKELARKGNEELWDKYGAEIDIAMKAVDFTHHQNTTMWRNAANQVFGQHINDIRQVPPAAGPAIHIRHDGGPQVPQAAAPPAGGGDKDAKLTNDELKVAKRFRMSPEKYAERKKENLSQSDELLDPIGPSSWDRYVTFSTQDKREAARKAREKAGK